MVSTKPMKHHVHFKNGRVVSEKSRMKLIKTKLVSNDPSK